jgi:hypothetical protein
MIDELSGDITKIFCWMCISQTDIRLLSPTEALVYARKEIDHATFVNEDLNLYAPLFRNVSVFKRYPYLFIFLLLNSVIIASDCY